MNTITQRDVNQKNELQDLRILEVRLGMGEII